MLHFAAEPIKACAMNRYEDREKYFTELAQTSKDYYIDYIRYFKEIRKGTSVLEIGCGEGGNLLPFADLGCRVAGIDILPNKINNAKTFFSARNAKGDFFCSNFLKATPLIEQFDIILIHDVIEHIEPGCKDEFFMKIRNYLKPDGIVFFGFPAWHMPYGGHQQICRSKMCRIPFIHLLPKTLYRAYLNVFKEAHCQIEELLGIKRSRMTAERFENLCKRHDYIIKDRRLWLISPHYRAKFGLTPTRLCSPFCNIPYLRNYFSTSCFYVIGSKAQE